MADTLDAWHFLPADGRPRWDIGRGRRKPIAVGTTYRVKGPLVLCERGLHASVKPLDALGYAPGPIVCRVRLSGEIITDTDKAVATQRTVLAMGDATEALREFIRDTLSFRQPHIVTIFETAGLPEHAQRIRKIKIATASFEDIKKVFDAAWDAARDAAWAAARDAARAAAGAAAGDAARAAAWAAARDAQSDLFKKYFCE